jgi:hypothetical protein
LLYFSSLSGGCLTDRRLPWQESCRCLCTFSLRRFGEVKLIYTAYQTASWSYTFSFSRQLEFSFYLPFLRCKGAWVGSFSSLIYNSSWNWLAFPSFVTTVILQRSAPLYYPGTVAKSDTDLGRLICNSDSNVSPGIRVFHHQWWLWRPTR